MSYPPNPRPGVPVRIAISPASTSLEWGETVQLSATLTDATGATVEASQAFVFASSNPGVSVDESGNVTANTPASGPWPEGASAVITATYPFGGGGPGAGIISASAIITVTPTPSFSAFVPAAPGTSLDQCKLREQASPNGAGWKAIRTA
jgi:uncharacterized protein YjdB